MARKKHNGKNAERTCCVPGAPPLNQVGADKDGD